MLRRKIWKRHQQSVNGNYSSYYNNCRETSQEYASVVGYWNVLKETLQEVTDRSYELTKSPVTYIERWCWNDISNSVSEKRKLRMKWKRGNKNKEKSNVKQREKDLETLCGRMIRNVMRLQRGWSKIIDGIRNDYGVLAASDEDKKITWQS